MKKEVLQTFMKRYNLGGLVDKLKWKYIAQDKTLNARVAIDNKSFIVDVVRKNFDGFGADDLTICVGDSEKIKKMMAPFGDDIDFTINRQGDRILGFTMSDADCESYCTAADPIMIAPVAKNLQDLPEYHVKVTLTEDFIDKFRTAQAALKDITTFSVGMNRKGLFEVVIGYTTSNSNRIRMTPPTDPNQNKMSSAIIFPIQNVIEVLKVNADIPNGTMQINSNGILKLSFENPDYTCTYYQFCNKKL